MPVRLASSAQRYTRRGAVRRRDRLHVVCSLPRLPQYCLCLSAVARARSNSGSSTNITTWIALMRFGSASITTRWGWKPRKEIARRLGTHRCRLVSLPHKDINECPGGRMTQDEVFRCLETAAYLIPMNFALRRSFCRTPSTHSSVATRACLSVRGRA